MLLVSDIHSSHHHHTSLLVSDDSVAVVDPELGKDSLVHALVYFESHRPMSSRMFFNTLQLFNATWIVQRTSIHV